MSCKKTDDLTKKVLNQRLYIDEIRSLKEISFRSKDWIGVQKDSGREKVFLTK